MSRSTVQLRNAGSAVVGYPTNFGAMSEEDLYLLTTRGEQLVRLLLPRYCPSLVG